MIDRTYRDDPYEYMSQEPCDYCPYQNTDKCHEGNCGADMGGKEDVFTRKEELSKEESEWLIDFITKEGNT